MCLWGILIMIIEVKTHTVNMGAPPPQLTSWGLRCIKCSFLEGKHPLLSSSQMWMSCDQLPQTPGDMPTMMEWTLELWTKINLYSLEFSSGHLFVMITRQVTGTHLLIYELEMPTKRMCPGNLGTRIGALGFLICKFLGVAQTLNQSSLGLLPLCEDPTWPVIEGEWASSLSLAGLGQGDFE